MSMTPEYLEHLKMIQGVVTRLATNSFSYKGWSITLLTALFLLAAKDGRPGYALVGVIPVVCFWWLDAYYNCQERLFRRLFDEVRQKGLAQDAPAADFSMKTSPPPPGDPKAKNFTVPGVAFSSTVLWLHIPLLLSVIAVALIVCLAGKAHSGT